MDEVVSFLAKGRFRELRLLRPTLQDTRVLPRQNWPSWWLDNLPVHQSASFSEIMFHDADSSGTLSVGDEIYIGQTAESWDEVRLYSISADAYSDENPMHDAP